MSNFSHKVNENETKSIEMAKNIKNKCKINTNRLSFILHTNFNTGTFEKFNIEEVNDFPKLKQKHIVEHITFGTYQLRLAKSYLIDIKKNLIAKRLSKNYNKNQIIDNIKPDHKLIAAEIKSRHKNSVNYKCFIEYLPTFESKKLRKNVENISGNYNEK